MASRSLASPLRGTLCRAGAARRSLAAQSFFQSFQALHRQALEVRHPPPEFVESDRIKTVKPLLSIRPDMDQVRLPQRAKVVRDGRLAHRKQLDKIADRKLAGSECFHNLAPNRIS